MRKHISYTAIDVLATKIASRRYRDFQNNRVFFCFILHKCIELKFYVFLNVICIFVQDIYLI